MWRGRPRREGPYVTAGTQWNDWTLLHSPSPPDRKRRSTRSMTAGEGVSIRPTRQPIPTTSVESGTDVFCFILPLPPSQLLIPRLENDPEERPQRNLRAPVSVRPHRARSVFSLSIRSGGSEEAFRLLRRAIDNAA